MKGCQKLCLALTVLLALTLTLGACARKPKSTAEVPTLLSHRYQISVAPFSQPRSNFELIAGNLPEPQGQIGQEDLLRLDRAFKGLLQSGGKRIYTFLTSPLEKASTHLHMGTQPMALSAWLNYGQKHKAELLLVPFVLNWHERSGSKAGVTSSAEVRVEFFLLNIPKGSIMNRSSFEEKQEALVDNFLKIGTFLKRKGAWVEAQDLALEGMAKAKKEFGL